MILLVDNYDSFVHNLARYFARLGQTTRVARNDALTVADVRRLQPEAIVLSPGPCTPVESGISLELVRELHTDLPILGICLGHQTIAAALGGRVVRAPQPVHGRTSLVEHTGSGVFAGLPNPLVVGRYHSLVVEEDSLPGDLAVTARTVDGIVMAMAHRRLPIVGLQFHPESVLTQHGYDLLAGFLSIANIKVVTPFPTIDTERALSQDREYSMPSAPVTF